MPLRQNSSQSQKNFGLLVQLDQAGQMLVTVVCDLLVASEQLLCTLRECTSQAAVTGLVCQQCLILLASTALEVRVKGFLP